VEEFPQLADAAPVEMRRYHVERLGRVPVAQVATAEFAHELAAYVSNGEPYSSRAPTGWISRVSACEKTR
jgi:hypothetical protein